MAVLKSGLVVPNATETARRYPEAYEWSAKREQQGRGRMKSAKFIAVFVAAISGLLVYATLASITKSPSAAAMLGVLVAGVLGLAFYEWWYSSGLKIVLSAQQMLVAIDTEHNTREIAVILRGNSPNTTQK